MDRSRKAQNLASFSAVLIVLIFTSLFKGLLSQKSEYKIMVPTTITVQTGLCGHIPCSFTFPWSGSGKLYGYWFQKKHDYWMIYVTSYSYHTVPGILVASNDKRGVMKKSVENRFEFTGDLTKGNCSFSILDAKPEDAGEYYFRIESPEVQYSYKYNKGQTWPLVVRVTELTVKPQIQNSSALLSGKEAVFTCSAPGPCVDMKAKISWTTILLDYRTSQWSNQHSSGSWTYGSDLVFTPSEADQGKWLTCRIWYPNVKKQIANTAFVGVVEQPKVDQENLTTRRPPRVTRRRQPAPRNEFWGSSVTIFLIVQYLFKLLFCFLFFISVFWLINWTEKHRGGTTG